MVFREPIKLLKRCEQNIRFGTFSTVSLSHLLCRKFCYRFLSYYCRKRDKATRKSEPSASMPKESLIVAYSFRLDSEIYRENCQESGITSVVLALLPRPLPRHYVFNEVIILLDKTFTYNIIHDVGNYGGEWRAYPSSKVVVIGNTQCLYSKRHTAVLQGKGDHRCNDSVWHYFRWAVLTVFLGPGDRGTMHKIGSFVQKNQSPLVHDFVNMYTTCILLVRRSCVGIHTDAPASSATGAARRRADAPESHEPVTDP